MTYLYVRFWSLRGKYLSRPCCGGDTHRVGPRAIREVSGGSDHNAWAASLQGRALASTGEPSIGRGGPQAIGTMWSPKLRGRAEYEVGAVPDW